MKSVLGKVVLMGSPKANPPSNANSVKEETQPAEDATAASDRDYGPATLMGRLKVMRRCGRPPPSADRSSSSALPVTLTPRCFALDRRRRCSRRVT